MFAPAARLLPAPLHLARLFLCEHGLDLIMAAVGRDDGALLLAVEFGELLVGIARPTRGQPPFQFWHIGHAGARNADAENVAAPKQGDESLRSLFQ